MFNINTILYMVYNKKCHIFKYPAVVPVSIQQMHQSGYMQGVTIYNHINQATCRE